VVFESDADFRRGGVLERIVHRLLRDTVEMVSHLRIRHAHRLSAIEDAAHGSPATRAFCERSESTHQSIVQESYWREAMGMRACFGNRFPEMRSDVFAPFRECGYFRLQCGNKRVQSH